MTAPTISRPEVNAAFAAWLQAERKRAGMSQQQIADLLKASGQRISQSQLAKIERGERMAMPLDLLVGITAVFGATPDVALGLSPDSRVAVDAEMRKAHARRAHLLVELREAINAELGVSR